MKRIQWIALAAGLLLLTAPTLGLITTWSAALADSWNTVGAWSGGVPGANDTVLFDGTGVGSCLINAAAVCNRIVVSHTSQAIGIGATMSLTVGVGGFVMTDGAFADGGNVVTVDGTIRIVDPAVTTSYIGGNWLMTGSGDLENATSTNKFNSLVVSGAGTIVATRVGNVYAESLVVGEADSVKGAYTFHVVPDVDYFFANAGVVIGGYTVIHLATDRILNGFTIQESLKVYGTGLTDSLIPYSAIAAAGVEMSLMAWDDGGHNVTSAGSIVIHDTATALHSTAIWTQTSAGTVVNRRPANAFSKYVVTATCLDTIFYNPSSTNDSFTVADTFTVTGTRGSTFLYGDPTFLYGDPARTLMFLPLTATATDCDIENLHVKNHVLRAVGCMARGHMSGVLCQQ